MMPLRHKSRAAYPQVRRERSTNLCVQKAVFKICAGGSRFDHSKSNLDGA